MYGEFDVLNRPAVHFEKANEKDKRTNIKWHLSKQNQAKRIIRINLTVL